MSTESTGRLAISASPALRPKLIVLTDLHMTPDGERIIGLDPYDRLAAAVAHINTHHPDAAHVIVLGDLTHAGDAQSYDRVGALLARLTPPVHVMAGNHDNRDALRARFPSAQRTHLPFLQSSFTCADHTVILLDTVRNIDGEQGHPASGHLCNTRLAWLSDQLHAAADRNVILAMHHPPMPTGFPGMDAAGLDNPDALLMVLNRHRNVRHILAGHVHRTIHGTWHGHPFSIFKSTVHQQPMDLQSSSSSLSVNEPGAYGIILIDPAGLIVHTDDFDLADYHHSKQERAMSKLNFWDDKWDLDEKQCPCDIHLLDYLKDKNRTSIDIFHMGTGSHHIVGLRTASDGSNNHVFGITSSPKEYDDYIKLLIENPKLGFSYKVYFGDIYQIDRRLMPDLDMATLFHIGEFRTEHNEAYGAMTNVEMAQVLVDRLRPGGELLFYTGSFAYDQAKLTIAELIKRGHVVDAGTYKTLHSLRKKSG